MQNSAIISRKVMDDKTIVSEIRAGGVIVHVKSIFSGSKAVSNILFEIAKGQLNKSTQCPQ